MFSVARTHGPGVATEGEHSVAADELDAGLSPPPPPPVLAAAASTPSCCCGFRASRSARRAMRMSVCGRLSHCPLDDEVGLCAGGLAARRRRSWRRILERNSSRSSSPSPEFTGSGELILEKEIRELLFLLRAPSLPIESLANMYIDRYAKPLRIERFLTEGHQHGKFGCSLTDLLMRLNTTRVLEREEQHYIVPVEDAPKYLARGFKLAMPPASSDPNKIYVTFLLGSKFTEDDVRNYFSQYGTVNDVHIPPQGRRNHYGPVINVRIPLQKKRMFGYVSFQYPETVKQILSERCSKTSHFICGDDVFVEPYNEKHGPEMLAREDAHSIPGPREVSDVSVIHENHTGDNTTESSHVSNHLDEASEDQDR
ncbi:hypothetical protein C2845_PM03G11650 [Panicum miliaceum]|uniref:RRM domain-containing protein n=1 Tax=Panicum miliaceum TaxID=4540 RepID=A0A3L6TB98_PANMI|nr:hypothetical protein C2845_PM03G11650 [Panicum miliaceum]